MLVCPGIYSCDLDLDPMTLIYRLGLDILHTLTRAGLSTVIAQTGQTDRHRQM